MRDYEILWQELPSSEEVAENLSHARAELTKSHREGNGMVELVSDVDKFRAAIASGRLSCISQYVNLFLISFTI